MSVRVLQVDHFFVPSTHGRIVLIASVLKMLPRHRSTSQAFLLRNVEFRSADDFMRDEQIAVDDGHEDIVAQRAHYGRRQL